MPPTVSDRDPASLFLALCARLSPAVPPTVSAAWASRLASLYSANDRAYHTLAHVEWLLRLLPGSPGHPLGAFTDGGEDWTAAELAIWFHDAMYDPRAGKGDNERASEALWREFADEALVSGGMAGKVSRMILATVDHRLPEPHDATDAAFLDMDLSILAAPPGNGAGSDASGNASGWDIGYDEYASRIRREYFHYPDEAYKAGRAAVLRGFLARDRLYFSSRARDWEPRARDNLAREIAALSPPPS
ncbi:hypothetical protein DFJ74DRAFT_603308 [Hyaloraphidium curvatum]|nr:hypothetical protein DFJ74DRAFT_603308 [Hyaloraphidium curvatum]